MPELAGLDEQQAKEAIALVNPHQYRGRLWLFMLATFFIVTAVTPYVRFYHVLMAMPFFVLAWLVLFHRVLAKMGRDLRALGFPKQ